MHRRLGFNSWLFRNLWWWRCRLMRIAGSLWRSRSCSFIFGLLSSRRNNVKHDAIVDIDVTTHGILDVVSSDIEIVVQLGVHESWIRIVQRKLSQSLGSIHG